MSEISRYVDAALIVRNSRKIKDPSLVRESAEKHGVPISEGIFFEQVVRGAYNPRIPAATTREALKMKKVRTVKRLCMDYRGSGRVGYIGEGEVAWSDAGGALQPNDERFNQDMQLWDAIFALNPDVYVDLYYHLDICGGGNYFTGKELEKAHARGVEEEFVQQFVLPYYSAVAKLRTSGGVELNKMW